MGEEPVVSLEGAEDIIDTVGVNVSIVGGVHVAIPVVEGLPGLSVEFTVSEGWFDKMLGLDVTKHIFGFWVNGIIPEVGVSSNSTFAPVGTVIDAWAPSINIARGESRPMSTGIIVTGDIFLAITVDVSPCGP